MTKRRSVQFVYTGGFIIIAFVIVAIVAPYITAKDPFQIRLAQKFVSPSKEHLFGLNEYGQDVLALVLHGARVSLVVSLSVVFVSSLTGLIIGSFAAFFGRHIDNLLMRVVDLFQAFPNFLLALAIVALLDPSITNVIFALCLTSWTGVARLVRGEILRIKEHEFVLAAKAFGSPPTRIVYRHIWPNLIGPLSVYASFAAAGAIVAESSLSFLGLGVPPETPTWGSLLNSGRQLLVEAPHIAAFPGVAIILLVLGFHLLGEGLRDLVDPLQD